MFTAADDVGALVVDSGSHMTRVGFAGDNAPKCVVPSFVGVAGIDRMSDSASRSSAKALVGHDLAYRRDGMEIIPAVIDGLISNYNATEAVWRHAIDSVMQVNAAEHPILLVESTFNDAPRREKMCELVIEKFGSPAVFIAKDAVLSAFAAGRSTALVLQSGAGLTSAVAVHDGYALMQSCLRTRVAGNALDVILEKLLMESSKHAIEPRFMFQRKPVPEGRAICKVFAVRISFEIDI